MSNFDLSISFSTIFSIFNPRQYISEDHINIVALLYVRVASQSKFSLVYSLLITMYRHTEVGRGGLSRESYEAVFSSLGAFVLRGQERTVQARLSSSPIPRLNFVPLCTAARLKTTPRERSSAIVSMDSYRAPSSRTSTSFPPLPSPSLPVSSIHSQIYSYGALFLGSLSSSPFGEHHSPFLCSDIPIDCFYSHTLAFRSIIRARAVFPSIAFAFASTNPSPAFRIFFQFLRFLLRAFCSYFYPRPPLSTTLDL